MHPFQLILREILHRKWQTLLPLFAVMAAVTFYVSFETAGKASQKETVKIMAQMGYNLRIIPKETDMNLFWDQDFSNLTMPEDYLNAFMEYTQSGILYNHLLATLSQEISWRGLRVVLCGIAAEVCPPGKQKPTLIYEIPPDAVYIGYEVARSLGLQESDTVDVQGKTFTIVRILPEKGTKEDIFIWAHLPDVQAILNQPGRINEIKALECRCMRDDIDSLAMLRKQLAEMIPDAKVIQTQPIAIARQKQRKMSEEYFGLVMPLVILACGIWIGALAMMNTQERKQEIGILHALGYRSSTISFLFLGKAVFIGVVGAFAGFGVGVWIAVQFGSQIFPITASQIKIEYSLLFTVLCFAPLLSASASFIPTMIGIAEDPADVLKDES
jgi:putative ABC transport system permease protein